MTKYEAEALEVLYRNPDIDSLIKIEEEDYIRECKAQLARNFRTSRDEFMYYQGVISGMSRMLFKTRLEVAKKILGKEEDNEPCIVSTTASR